jgi:hypothetical protein
MTLPAWDGRNGILSSSDRYSASGLPDPTTEENAAFTTLSVIFALSISIRKIVAKTIQPPTKGNVFPLPASRNKICRNRINIDTGGGYRLTPFAGLRAAQWPTPP